MTHKKIEQYREKLIEIIERTKQPDGNPAKGTKEDLQELAKKIGANTRAIYTGSNGEQKGYDAGISDLTDNIHTALQTASMIEACKSAAWSWKVAALALVISVISIIVALWDC